MYARFIQTESNPSKPPKLEYFSEDSSSESESEPEEPHTPKVNTANCPCPPKNTCNSAQQQSLQTTPKQEQLTPKHKIKVSPSVFISPNPGNSGIPNHRLGYSPSDVSFA